MNQRIKNFAAGLEILLVVSNDRRLELYPDAPGQIYAGDLWLLRHTDPVISAQLLALGWDISGLPAENRGWVYYV